MNEGKIFYFHFLVQRLVEPQVLITISNSYAIQLWLQTWQNQVNIKINSNFIMINDKEKTPVVYIL